MCLVSIYRSVGVPVHDGLKLHIFRPITSGAKRHPLPHTISIGPTQNREAQEAFIQLRRQACPSVPYSRNDNSLDGWEVAGTSAKAGVVIHACCLASYVNLQSLGVAVFSR